MLRNELEYRNARRQLDNLRTEIEKRSLAAERETPPTAQAVVGALEMKIDDIKRELDDYENLKSGDVSEFVAGSLDEFGEVVTKARIARGWSQADLAEVLGTHAQQIQRYERNDWQKINLWRLQEVVEALRLRLTLRAHLEYETEGLGTPWPRVASASRAQITTASAATTISKASKENRTAQDQPAAASAQRSTELAPAYSLAY